MSSKDDVGKNVSVPGAGPFTGTAGSSWEGGGTGEAAEACSGPWEQVSLPE